METGLITRIVVLALLLAGVVWLVRAWVKLDREQARDRDALREWAAQHGWSSSPSGGGPWADFLPSGRRGKIRPQLWGTWEGREVTVAVHEYIRAAGQYTLPDYHTIVVVRLRRKHPPVKLADIPRQGRDDPGAPPPSGANPDATRAQLTSAR
jgi:hypothetical protein